MKILFNQILQLISVNRSLLFYMKMLFRSTFKNIVDLPVVTALNYSDTIVDTVHQDVDCDRIASKGVKETTHIKNGVLETDL